MYDQLQSIEDRYEELGELLSDPEVITDTKRFMQLSKEEANTRETVEVYRRYKEVVQGIKDTEELLGEKLDDDMAEMAKEELSELKKEKEELEEKIKILLLPKDPNDDKNIIMEIRGAAGGDEVALFAGEIDIEDKDIRTDIYHASGAGGQHVNKTASAVRLTHLPTGIVVAMQDERSQLKNREKAMKILRARVYDKIQQEAQSEYDANRKSAVGTGDRSERIRTYNFPQNRVTDHRIGLTIQKLDQILAGKLDEIVDALIMYDQTSKLEAMQNG